MRKRCLTNRFFQSKFIVGLLVFGIVIALLAGSLVWKVKLQPNSCLTFEDLSRLNWKPVWIWNVFKGNEEIQKYPCADKIITQSQFPGTIRVTVIQREPVIGVAGLATENASTMSANLGTATQYFLMDSKGYVYSKIENRPNLPFVWIARPIAVGDQFDNLVKLNWSDITSNVQKNWDNYLSMIFREPGDLELRLTDMSILLPANQTFLERLDAAKTVYINAKREGKKLSRIDYRFEKLVISY